MNVSWVLLVFSARKSKLETDYETKGRHVGPVWDIAWNVTVNIAVEHPNVISVGSDGRVTLWSVTSLNKLVPTDLFLLKSSHSTFVASEKSPENESERVLMDKATAIEFAPDQDTNSGAANNASSSETDVKKKPHSGSFLVATEQGWIHTCNSRCNLSKFESIW